MTKKRKPYGPRPSKLQPPGGIGTIEMGERMRARRKVLGMSQTTLAEVARVSFQQIQKYENGKNLIPVTTLQTLSKALDVSPMYFFAGSAEVRQPELKVLGLHGAAELLENYGKTKDQNARLMLCRMAEYLAAKR